ncbi:MULTISPECIES: DUF305 domain-containing protein [unclassified Gordonia (in: high G+C Gram-positive bacteria)]|uniref:DUF305 domain-containing protein n=1 Tax=unclassified Gordonia (in: high G+C Gram-positive bacteria) TaxID=2657482 RepID=UPI0009EE8A3A|nr:MULTISPECIES: DUF305 domain-containing protein [unclassified Gordonia (in: high G+C Gram-positive bacteria)]
MSSNTIRRTRMLAACAGVAVVVGIAGCSTSESGSDSASGEASSTSADASRNASSSQSASAESTTHNAADVTFNQMMIPHHQQAIAMADLVPSRTDNTAVRELATQIKNAQQPEINQMTERLRSWGVSTTPESQSAQDHGSMDHGSMDHGSMDMGDGAEGMGMMSEQEMTAMENARGQEFDTLWLKGMIAHHQGAIDMAKTELADGIDPASRALAEQITTSQQAEIDRMRSMLGQ